MTKDKINELLPYFALKHAREINPEKYGNVTAETFAQAIGDSQGDIDEIAKAAAALTDEDWMQLETEYDQASKIPSAKNGAKLLNLNKLRAGKKLPAKTKKCKCGCDMIDTKEAGGKIVSSCSCKCSGGKMPKAIDGKKLEYLQKIKK